MPQDQAPPQTPVSNPWDLIAQLSNTSAAWNSGAGPLANPSGPAATQLITQNPPLNSGANLAFLAQLRPDLLKSQLAAAQQQPAPSTSLSSLSAFNPPPPISNWIAAQPMVATNNRSLDPSSLPQATTLLDVPERIRLLSVLLQQQQQQQPTFNQPQLMSIPQFPSTSALLAEQQAREAELQRQNLLKLQSLLGLRAPQPAFMWPSNTSGCGGNEVANRPRASTAADRVQSECIGADRRTMDVSTLAHGIRAEASKTASHKDAEMSDLAAASGAPNTRPNREASLPQTPYFPTHFMRGTVLQVTGEARKRVETLALEDFSNLGGLAESVHDMRILVGRVTEIRNDEETTTPRYVSITFETEKHLEPSGDIEISSSEINVPVEYPFFELKKRFSSVSPTKTKSLYGLECSKLEVDDCCLVLTAFDEETDDGELEVEENPALPSPNLPQKGRLSPVLEISRSNSQLSSSSASGSSVNRLVPYFRNRAVEMDDHVVI